MPSLRVAVPLTAEAATGTFPWSKLPVVGGSPDR
jgi:hypothetical protein